MGLKVVTGIRYFWWFIGYGEAEKRWMTGKFEGWKESVRILAGISRKHLQSSYARLQKSLQQEWEFIQRVTPGIEDTFRPV